MNHSRSILMSFLIPMSSSIQIPMYSSLQVLISNVTVSSCPHVLIYPYFHVLISTCPHILKYPSPHLLMSPKYSCPHVFMSHCPHVPMRHVHLYSSPFHLTMYQIVSLFLGQPFLSDLLFDECMIITSKLAVWHSLA